MFSKKIVEAGKLFDTAVLEHLIIAAGYYSFSIPLLFEMQGQKININKYLVFL